MIREHNFVEKIQTVPKNLSIYNCLNEFLMDKKGNIVVTVISETDEKEIWSEAEMENKNEVLEWIRELSESCTIKLIHISTNQGFKKTWKINNND